MPEHHSNIWQAKSSFLRRQFQQELRDWRYHASVDHEALGYHITAFIHMALDPKQKPTFYPFVEACPNVLECNCVTGAHSMLMKVCFPNTMDLDSFIGQLQRFGSTETQIVFSTPVPTRGVVIDTDELDSSEAI